MAFTHKSAKSYLDRSGDTDNSQKKAVIDGLADLGKTPAFEPLQDSSTPEEFSFEPVDISAELGHSVTMDEFSMDMSGPSFNY